MERLVDRMDTDEEIHWWTVRSVAHLESYYLEKHGIHVPFLLGTWKLNITTDFDTKGNYQTVTKRIYSGEAEVDAEKGWDGRGLGRVPRGWHPRWGGGEIFDILILCTTRRRWNIQHFSSILMSSTTRRRWKIRHHWQSTSSSSKICGRGYVWVLHKIQHPA